MHKKLLPFDPDFERDIEVDPRIPSTPILDIIHRGKIKQLRPYLLSTVDVDNHIFYSEVHNIHGPDGFSTPASHHADALGRCIATHCIETQFLPWLLEYQVMGKPPHDFIITEMGGGRGYLLKSFLAHFTEQIKAIIRDRKLSMGPIFSYIKILPLDQSPNLLKEQKQVVRDSGLQLIDCPEIDLGNTQIDRVPEQLKSILGTVSYAYTCELFDDISGDQIIDYKEERMVGLHTLYYVHNSQICPKLREQSLQKFEPFLTKKAYEYGIFDGRQGPFYLLTKDQVRVQRLYERHCKRRSIETLTIHEPIILPPTIQPGRDFIKLPAYVNTMTKFLELLTSLLKPTAGQLHIDYFEDTFPHRIGFYPDDYFEDLYPAYQNMIYPRLIEPPQQPTVLVNRNYILNRLPQLVETDPLTLQERVLTTTGIDIMDQEVLLLTHAILATPLPAGPS